MNNMVYMKLEDYDRLKNRLAGLERSENEARDELFFLKTNITDLIDEQFDYKLKQESTYIDPYFFIDAKKIAELVGLDWEEMKKNWVEEKTKLNEEREKAKNENKKDDI